MERLNRRYDNLFGCSFPYSMGWHGRPADGRGPPRMAALRVASSRPCCARPRCGSSWSATSWRRSRSGTSPPRTRPRGCARCRTPVRAVARVPTRQALTGAVPASALARSPAAGLLLVILAAGRHPHPVRGLARGPRAPGCEVNNFLNSHTLIQTATDASFFAIMAVGATIVIISGGIDLSVGSIYALAGVTMALVLRALGPVLGRGRRWPHRPRHLRGVGLVCGLVNGAAGGRPAGPPVHHHAGHDVGPARDRLRDQQGGEHPGAGALTAVAKASLGLAGSLYPVPMLHDARAPRSSGRSTWRAR